MTDLPDFCQRCGCCSIEFVDCWQCGGDGYTQPGDLYDEDPLWYGQDDVEPCHICHGEGSWPMCGGRCDDAGKHAPAEAQPAPLARDGGERP